MLISLATRLLPLTLAFGAATTPSLAQSWREDVLSPRSMLDRHVTHDFNGDGVPDVLGVGTALSTSGSRAAFLYLGRGDGTFLRKGKVQRGLIPPHRMLACDVNGDGGADAVLFNAATGSVVLLEGNGDGTFGAPRLLAAVGGNGSEVLGSLRCVDGDGDGDLDLYFNTRNIGAANGVYWIEQTAPDTFASPLMLTPSAIPVVSFNVANLDGSGDADIVVAAGSQGLLFFPDAGGGSPTGPLPIQMGTGAGSSRDVQPFDVDRDGQLDLLATDNTGSSRVVYYRNLSGGAFAPAVQIEQTTDPVTSLVFGDLDGDGHDDIAFEQSERRCAAVLVFPGPLFSPRFPVVSPADQIGALDLADIDGDGRADGVFSGRLLFNLVGGSDPPVLGYWRSLGSNGSVVTFEPNVRIEPFGYYTTAMEVADVTGDGAPDLIVAGGQPRPLVIHFNGGAGALEETLEIPVTERRLLSLTAADVDGDQDVDLIYSLDGDGTVLQLARNQGDGTSWDVSDYHPTASTALTAGDLEGDGDMDALVTLRRPPVFNSEVAVAENLGAGAVAAPRVLFPLPSNSFFRGSAFKDVDGDGDADVVLGIINSGGGINHKLQYFRADPGGAYTGPIELDSSPGYSAQVSPRGFSDIEVEDFDGDGDQDILALGQFVTGGAVRLYRQTSPSVFGPPEVIVATPALGGAVGLDSFDGDADGAPDILVTFFRSTTEAADIQFLRNAGGGTFQGPLAISTVAIDPSYIASGDFDLDGDVDFVTSGYWIDDDEHFSLFTNDLFRPLGSDYCSPAVANSTGSPGSMTVVGSSLVQDNVARLRAWNLPRSTTGFFLTSLTPGEVSSVPGSVGILCLGGEIGRFAGPGQVKNTGATGTMALDVDLLAFPSPSMGAVSVLAGEAWYFQGWTRDAVAGTVTSNFTAPTTVTWQ